MTINVALLTSEALILGCDSIASSTSMFIEPWRWLERNEDGTPKVDGEGKFTARFSYSDYRPVVTDVWGGVTKMFELSRGPTRVAATTAGMAALSGRTIRNLAAEFLHENGAHQEVEQVANAFLAFMRGHYDAHYAASQLPDELKDDVEFLVGGYGRNDHFPQLYRLRVKENRVDLQYPAGQFGIAWAGQADAVARLIFGVDGLLKYRAERAVAKAMDAIYDQFSQAAAEIVSKVLAKLDEALPADVDTALPAKPEFAIPWRDFQLDIECENLPLQDGVDLVSYLVNVQSGRAKFVRGVATVGGRTRIGIITRGEDLRMLNEPEIVHRSTGFPVDL